MVHGILPFVVILLLLLLAKAAGDDANSDTTGSLLRSGPAQVFSVHGAG